MNQTCESCGARLDAGVEVCDLCGTPVEAAHAADEVQNWPPEADSPEQEEPTTRPDTEAGVPPLTETVSDTASDAVDQAKCPHCGHGNPGASRFCNQCGERLENPGAPTQTAMTKPASAPVVEEMPESGKGSRAPLEDSERAVGKQVVIVVSVALLLVVFLYAVTTMSGGSSGSFSAVAESPQGEQVQEPLASQWLDRESEIMVDVESSTGAEQIEARRRLIDLYFAADRLDFAAEQTAIIAEATNSEEEWILAGNLYFDTMQRAADTQKMPWAQKAVESYQKALTLNPDNLDVRTDMAIAYLYDPQNSMMAIQETNRVLEADSLHIQANFNRGIMLTQINRVETAIEQFEKVKRIVGDPEDPVYQRAVSAIERLSGS